MGLLGVEGVGPGARSGIAGEGEEDRGIGPEEDDRRVLGAEDLEGEGERDGEGRGVEERAREDMDREIAVAGVER